MKPVAQMTRREILDSVGYEPLVVPGVPAAALRAENRLAEDRLINFVRGMSAHMDKVEAAEPPAHFEAMTAAERAKALVCRGSGTCKRHVKRVLVVGGRRIPLCGVHTRNG